MTKIWLAFEALFDCVRAVLKRGGGGGGGGGAVLPEKALILYVTKICDIPMIPNPLYDLIKNDKPYLWPEPYIKILFQTCIIIRSPVQTNVKLP